jgi:hypothetical protein
MPRLCGWPGWRPRNVPPAGEGNADADGVVVLREHFAPKQSRHEGCHPLLPINEDALAGGRRAILQLHGWVAPGDQIANGVALIEGIEQVPDLDSLPHEGALDLGDGDFAGLNPGEEQQFPVRIRTR